MSWDRKEKLELVKAIGAIGAFLASLLILAVQSVQLTESRRLDAARPYLEQLSKTCSKLVSSAGAITSPTANSVDGAKSIQETFNTISGELALVDTPEMRAAAGN